MINFDIDVREIDVREDDLLDIGMTTLASMLDKKTRKAVETSGDLEFWIPIWVTIHDAVHYE